MAALTELFSTIIKIVTYAGIIQGFYSALVLTHTNRRNPANRYLVVLLIILSFSILHSVFIIPYFHHFHQTTFRIQEPFIMLVIPFIWLYVKKLNEPLFHFRIKHLVHFVPFVVVMLFSLTYIIHRSEVDGSTLFYSHTIVLNVVLYVVALCQYIFYLFYILRLIRNFKAKALEELSNTEYIDPAWLRIFLFTFLAVFLLLIGMMVIAIHRLNTNYFNTIVSVVFAFAVYILGYKGLFQQTMLPANAEPQKKKVTPEIKVDEQLLNKLLDFMNRQKPWHDPELTLTSLARQVEISRNLLSELINSGTGGNFYDFVNKYRVEEIKQLMANPKFKDFTLLAIALEAGFSSKSTFNSIFKKFTGITPSTYRNRLL